MERILITGASRGIGLAFARLYAQRGDRVFAGCRDPQTSVHAEELERAYPGQVTRVALDVSDEEGIRASLEQVRRHADGLDILINNAGIGGSDSRTGQQERLGTFHFDDAWRVLQVNGVAPLLIAQTYMDLLRAGNRARIACVTSGYGSVSGNTHGFPYYYSAAKSAVTNFTQWLAVHMAQQYTPRIRVNALAPGFFLTEQNRFLLTNKEDGSSTPRGQAILAHTPARRLGVPADLVSTLLWLVSPASDFVTGVVVPVDGGFSVFSGV